MHPDEREWRENNGPEKFKAEQSEAWILLDKVIRKEVKKLLKKSKKLQDAYDLIEICYREDMIFQATTKGVLDVMKNIDESEDPPENPEAPPEFD